MSRSFNTSKRSRVPCSRKRHGFNRWPRLKSLALELRMVYNLIDAGKINHRSFRDDKNILIVKVPLNFQQPHHPWIRILFDIQSHDTARATGLKFSLEFLQEIGFNILTFFECEITIAVDPEQVHAGDLLCCEISDWTLFQMMSSTEINEKELSLSNT